jgi:hypothetical protein
VSVLFSLEGLVTNLTTDAVEPTHTQQTLECNMRDVWHHLPEKQKHDDHDSIAKSLNGRPPSPGSPI